ncbi:predicted protein [Pyrenophora tritici-repentis Pt-1C-BFP]|uniref:Uncharacterized protein n=1 Tax=Pyrenophora tritici-repentis (strain Pt-1C-BFP) TaxID=426418 RepID=B2WID6_PYRTR|nr:uncharacterized protein PTRG_09745 [Pyrenophora tritici-repentis Pt-1C-BFP]EDU42796.1 predicted protein [Pyrenophora tritici-repentis Pt-1C-BFP]
MNTRIMLLGSELAGLQNVKEVATARTGPFSLPALKQRELCLDTGSRRQA